MNKPHNGIWNVNDLRKVFKMRVKISEVMSYEEFLERYLVNCEEFIFYYKDKEINLCYGPQGTFSYNVVKDNVLIYEENFSTRDELLNKMHIDNIRFPELWHYLE